MIPGAELAAWLADETAQARSRAALDASSRRFGAHPAKSALDARIAGMAKPSTADLLDAARAFLADRDMLDTLIDDLIALTDGDPFWRPPFPPVASDIHHALVLYAHPQLTILAGVSGVDMLAAKKAGPRGATSIGFTGTTSLYHFVKAGGAELSFWEAPEIGPGFVAAKAGKCRPAGRRRLRDGETLLIDGRRQSFVIEHAESDLFYFQAIVRGDLAAPVAVEYDSATREFVGASSTDEAASRIQMMASALRTMDREDAVPALLGLLDNPHFHTRWYLMRELLALDADAALPALRRMAANDPHEEVRAAAAATLAAFFPVDADSREAEPCPA